MEKGIEYIVCGNISPKYHMEEALLAYQKTRPKKRTNIGPYVKGHDIGAQRFNAGFKSMDISEGIIMQQTYINRMRVRIYRPKKAKEKLPCICYVHGGGFIAGDIYVVENPCKRLAQLSNSCVISFDYGLAPEHPYPEAIYQCYEAMMYIYEHWDIFQIDPNLIAVAGDSAGGNIAMAMAQLDAQKKHVIRYQILYYPVVDMRKEAKDYWSFDKYGVEENPYIMERVTSLLNCEDLLLDCYLQSHSPTETLTSPYLLDSIAELPPMIMCIAEFDYLRVQEEAFYHKFKNDIDIQVLCYKGSAHAFLDKLGTFPQSDDSLHRVSEAWKLRIRALSNV